MGIFRTHPEAKDHERECDKHPNPPFLNKKKEPFHVVLDRVFHRAPLFTGLGRGVMGLQQTDSSPRNSSHAHRKSQKREVDNIVLEGFFSSKSKNYAWVCDICCTATFPTYTEAEEHERKCDSTMTSSRLNKPDHSTSSFLTKKPKSRRRECSTWSKDACLYPFQKEQPPYIDDSYLQSKYPETLWSPPVFLHNKCIIDQPLSKDHRKQVQSVWVMLSEDIHRPSIITKNPKLSISSSDFMLLQPPKANRSGEICFKDTKKAWLNANIVHYFIDYSLRKFPSKKKYGVIHPSLIGNIMSHDCNHPLESQLKAHIFFDMDLFFIPINDKEKHWSLIILFPKDRSIRYFDSCGRTNNCHIQKVKAFTELSHFTVVGSKLPWNVHPCPWQTVKQFNGESKIENVKRQPTAQEELFI